VSSGHREGMMRVGQLFVAARFAADVISLSARADDDDDSARGRLSIGRSGRAAATRAYSPFPAREIKAETCRSARGDPAIAIDGFLGTPAR